MGGTNLKHRVLVEILEGCCWSQPAVRKPLSDLWMRRPATKVDLVSTNMYELIWKDVKHLA